MLILEISIVNTCAEIIDRFRLLNNVQINNTFVYYANNALYSETKIYTLNNIQKYCILWIFLHHDNISHCTYLFRLEFWHNHFNYRWLTWVLLIVVYLYNNLLGNTYIKSLPHLHYFDSIFTQICSFLSGWLRYSFRKYLALYNKYEISIKISSLMYDNVLKR